jgi:hypothetical protein
MIKKVMIIVLLLSLFYSVTGCSDSILGRYYSQKNSKDCIELLKDNKFKIFESGGLAQGKYQIKGKELLLQLKSQKTVKATIEDKAITDKDGDKWLLTNSLKVANSKIQYEKKTFLNYVKKNAVDPSSYVTNKLKEHEVVILGEMHEQKDNLDFISKNISSFYHDGGVRIFATEFVRSHNNKMINEIVTAKEFDYNRVVAIYRDFAWVWGYKGYIDIIESIWKLNNSLKADEEKLKIVGLDFEWQDWSGAKVESYEDRDKYMADMFIDTYGKDNKGKAIIHTGFNHSFWDFLSYGNRMGYYLHQTYGNRIFQICLHHNFYIGNTKQSIDDFYIPEFIDEIYYGNNNKPIGFDIIGSPFENIKDNISDFFIHDDKTVFGTVTKGYIVLKPLIDIEPTSFVEDFIDSSNFEKAKEIIKTRGWFEISDNISIDELNKKLSSFFKKAND